MPSVDWDYLRSFFTALERKWLKLSPRDFDAMDPALLRDLLILAAEDRFYEEQAREGKTDPVEALRQKMKGAVPFEKMR